jgi:hypothetical protein
MARGVRSLGCCNFLFTNDWVAWSMRYTLECGFSSPFAKPPPTKSKGSLYRVNKIYPILHENTPEMSFIRRNPCAICGPRNKPPSAALPLFLLSSRCLHQPHHPQRLRQRPQFRTLLSFLPSLPHFQPLIILRSRVAYLPFNFHSFISRPRRLMQ